MTDRASASQSVSERFSRGMKATTSRFGMLTDPMLVAVPTAVGVVVMFIVMRSDASPLLVRVVQALAALPVLVAVIVTVGLSGARGRVVDWLAKQPFPVENMNAVLNGVGEVLEVQLEGPIPTSVELNSQLDAVHPDAFVTSVDEERRSVEVRIGVIDSKRNPAASNHARYERIQLIVERVLVPLHREKPIVSVRVK
jgi:hypothetical protein